MSRSDNHIVTYVKRNIITRWKKRVLTKDKVKFAYGSNDKLFSAHMKDGSTLWVVSRVSDVRPPELVARIKVEELLKKNEKSAEKYPEFSSFFDLYDYVVKGDESESEFYGYNKSDKALLELVFKSSERSKLWKIAEDSVQWRSKFGSKLRGPRLVADAGDIYGELTAPGIKPFDNLSAIKKRTVFISWKWNDKIYKRVLQFAYDLADNGFMVWLDKLALPGAENDEELKKDAPKLEKLLKYGHHNSTAVIAIGSKMYGKKSKNSSKNWTLREWNGKISRRKRKKKMLQVVYPLISCPNIDMKRANYVISSKNTNDAAWELKEWFDSLGRDYGVNY